MGQPVASIKVEGQEAPKSKRSRCTSCHVFGHEETDYRKLERQKEAEAGVTPKPAPGPEANKATLEINCYWSEQSIETTLADGRKTLCELDTYVLTEELTGRTLHTDFIVLPESRDNRILLGCDFIQDVRAVINAQQGYWYFIYKPERKLRYFRPIETTHRDVP